MFTALKLFLSFAWALVVQYIKGDQSGLLKQRDAELASADARIDALEAAAAKERAERLRVVDEKAAAVTDVVGADELLRGVTGADNPETN